ncbi:MAG TPA: hypothetical protein PLD73_15700 [Candidatus Hydrogenedentes bacterium]|nr:hypothetical protein [Candidatus Hydrogenedentota bacterium]HPJ98759.1 hypothetical protein [Candidatus Hydrogenedentota bacterium]
MTVHAAAEFKIQKTFVENADVLAVETGEVDRRHHPRTGPALADRNSRSCEHVEQLPHQRIIHDVLLETGIFKNINRPFHTV